MSKNRNRDNNSNTKAIIKANENLTSFERKADSKRLRLRAICQHTDGPMSPCLSPRKDAKTGKVTWVCKACGEIVDLRRIDEGELAHAAETISQACNLIKIMADPSSEQDDRLLEQISEVQMGLHYVRRAYSAALNSSNRKKQRNRNNGGAKTVIWN